MDIHHFIKEAIAEDIGDGDHTSLACIAGDQKGKVQLLVKEQGIAAGIELAQLIFSFIDERIEFRKAINDGDAIRMKDVLFIAEGNVQSLLKAERLVLNCMQRMSGIATITSQYVNAVKSSGTKILDTRKTTPLCRMIEKWAVRIGGGHNHRFGLYDMILIKDNHIDFAGGIAAAIQRTLNYLESSGKKLVIEIETRNLEEVEEVLRTGNVQRILLDNMQPAVLTDAVKLINKRFETEASGGITFNTVRQYAETGVDYISVGALTHSARSLDLSLKAF